MERSLIIPSAILALGLIIAIGFFAWTWKDAKNADQTITVTGSAKREIVSDLGIFRGSIAIESGTAESAYHALKTQKPILIQYLTEQGFPLDKVKFFPATSSPVYQYNADGVQTGIRAYTYSQRMQIQSSDVKKIEQLSLDISSVIERGVYFNIEQPEYYYTKLASVKIRIQAEAARDAMTRAERIAAATRRSLGPLRSARMGVLQITPKNSNEISDYGVNDVSSIEKEITSVVNASFQIN